MKLKPLGDRVVLRRERAPEKIGLIHIPDSAKEKPLEAIVVAAGPGAHVGERFVEMLVKKDDRVLVGKYSGSEVVIDGVEHLVVRQDDIIGIIE